MTGIISVVIKLTEHGKDQGKLVLALVKLFLNSLIFGKQSLVALGVQW